MTKTEALLSLGIIFFAFLGYAIGLFMKDVELLKVKQEKEDLKYENKKLTNALVTEKERSRQTLEDCLKVLEKVC